MSIRKRLAVTQAPSNEKVVSQDSAGVRFTEVWHESEMPPGTPWWVCPSELRRMPAVVKPPVTKVTRPEVIGRCECKTDRYWIDRRGIAHCSRCDPSPSKAFVVSEVFIPKEER